MVKGGVRKDQDDSGVDVCYAVFVEKKFLNDIDTLIKGTSLDRLKEEHELFIVTSERHWFLTSHRLYEEGEIGLGYIEPKFYIRLEEKHRDTIVAIDAVYNELIAILRERKRSIAVMKQGWVAVVI